MKDTVIDFGPCLRGLDRSTWIDEIEELVGYDGALDRLGDRHVAAFTRHSSTLLVSFETLAGIQALAPNGHPLGWEMVKSEQWSSLSLVSTGDTWFRDPDVYAYFDRLADDGFFDTFETVLFYGAGPCGYAAAAFSVAAPGATVLALEPQATLAPHLTEWDKRFADQRRVDFTSRYGYAPQMLEAATQAFIIYDPRQIEDAMHAALFDGPNITKLRMPLMGTGMQMDLTLMEILFPLMKDAAEGQLTPARFARLARSRRDFAPYLRRLLAHADKMDRDDLARSICHNVTARLNLPRFARRLENMGQDTV